jgi:predicted transcriptional regulator
MADDAVFTLEFDADLRDRFMAEAEALGRPAAQIMRELMDEFLARRAATREHDAWFQTEVEDGVREADDPTVQRIPNRVVSADWGRDKSVLLKRQTT